MMLRFKKKNTGLDDLKLLGLRCTSFIIQTLFVFKKRKVANVACFKS